ncbi:MAG TPA: hypothetical protein VK594_10050 [Streptosporangiaceae bacterium]|nr:hypothetical protein [Streptosporangiaceae bacterium]
MSDTTDLLGGAPSASEDAPVGNSAPPADSPGWASSRVSCGAPPGSWALAG